MIIRNPAKAAAAAASPPDRAALGDTQTNLKPMKPIRPGGRAAAATAAAGPAAAAPRPRRPPAAGRRPRAPPAAAPAPAAAGTPLREAAIQVLSGAAAGRTLDLTKNLTTIGKPGPAGGGDHQAPQRLLHHPRGGGDVSRPSTGPRWAGRRTRWTTTT